MMYNKDVKIKEGYKMTKKQAKEILLEEYTGAMKGLRDVEGVMYREYAAGICYFMGWISRTFEITQEDMDKASDNIYK